MNSKISVVLLSFLVCGCGFGEPSKETKEKIKIMREEYRKDPHRPTLLFEIDNVKVYRFYDNGNIRYFTTPKDTTVRKNRTTGEICLNG
jgi:hypothetical protein